MPTPETPFQPYAHRFADGTCKDCPTALEVVKDAGALGNMSDKVMIITGASAGIGIETAKALHETGAKLYLAVRNLEKGAKVVENIKKSSSSAAPIELLQLDTANLESVRKAASTFLSKEKTLNVLVNNAGIMACPFGLTADGFETQIGTNHFGHFLFFQLLKQTLLSSSTPSFQSRVVNTSSSGHTMGTIRFDDINFSKGDYSPFASYGQSKLANVYMANSIERHYGSQGLHAFSLHPGVIMETELARHMTPEDMAGMDLDAFAKVAKSPPQGAATQVWAAISPQLEGRGGTYLADVGEALPAGPDEQMGGPGHSSAAYNEEAEEKFWELSCEMVGVNED